MKAIMVNNDTIISLENVKDITLKKPKPEYNLSPYIIVHYISGDFTRTPSADLATVQTWLNKMYEIILKD